jgi:hypothetical protein
MAQELDRVRRGAEELVMRRVGSRAAREAGTRKLKRTARAVGRRLFRSALTFVILLGLVIIGVATGWLGWVTAPLALIGSMMMALLVLFWPARARPAAAAHEQDVASVPLDRLAADVDDWLVERARLLPQRAGPALDLIVDKLRALQPSLAGLDPDSAAAGETRRLIGQHLPSLIDTYIRLPAGERGYDSANAQGLADSLGIVADELADLCDRICDEGRRGFETERRFIETRYRGGGGGGE